MLMAPCYRVAGDPGRELDAVGLPVAAMTGLLSAISGEQRRPEEAYLDILPIRAYM
jgi:hypothetical protein